MTLPGLLSWFVLAQQTLFNHPSADILDPGQVYLELDATERFGLGFEGILVRAVWGAFAPVELGIHIGPFFGRDYAGEGTVAPNAKVRMWSVSWRAAEVSTFAGSRVYVPLSGGSIGFEGYASMALATSFGLRMTAGGYGLIASNNGWSQGGVTATAEMILHRHVTLAVEWWQKRDLGAGLVVAMPKGVTAYAAYLLSPNGRDRDGIILELGWVF